MTMKKRVLSFLEESEQRVVSFLEESEQRVLLFLEEREKEKMKLCRFLRNGSALQEGLLAASNGKYEVPIRGFTAEELMEATKGFSQSLSGDPNGVMFRGHLGTRPILVRKWPETVMFLPEIYREVLCDAVITAMMSHHKNVLRLIGCCLEFEYPALVYEYTGSGILSCILDSTDKNPKFLSWKTRVKIASDIGNAIVYLHSAFPTPIIHRDLKPSKVIIDEHGIAKLVDFSLAVVLPPGESRVIDLVYGTPVFLDPEYYESRFVSEKSDVYSFGIFLLILLTGKTALCEHPGGGNISILEYVRHNKDQFIKLVDPKIKEEAEGYVDQTFDFLDLAMSCTNARGQDRPNMIDVAKKLRSIEKQVCKEKKRSELCISRVQPKEVLQKMGGGGGSKGCKGMKQLPNSNGRFLREEGEPFRHQNEYRVIKEFFTIRLHWNGEFKKFRGRRAYVGGWERVLSFMNKGKQEKIKLSRFLRNGSTLQEALIAASNGKYGVPIRGFTVEELTEATKGFSQSFPGDHNGVTFRGHLGNRPILVRKWPESVMFLPGIYREVMCDAVITAMMSHHKNVLRLIGCCLEFEYPALVYEYSGPGILSCILDSTGKNPTILSWKTRVKIASDIGNAIVYLHTAFPTPIIHRDLKPSKVIIDDHGVAKLVDFSLAVVLPPGESRVVDFVYGTPVFLDPEYYESSFVTEKSDVYSFGIFLLMLLTGKTALCEHPGGGQISILEYARRNQDRFIELVDPKIEEEAERYVEQTFEFLDLAISCTTSRGEDRPNMIDVAKKLRSIEKQVCK